VRILIADADDGRSDGAASTFTQSEILTLGSPPVAVLAKDLNADRTPDLAVVSGETDELVVFLGTGDGTFRAPTTYATGDAPNAVVALDLNNDGVLDLAVSNFASGDISLFFGEGVAGRGDGTFVVADTLPTGDPVCGITKGDFNADGRPDLAAILNPDNEREPAVVAVFEANGFDPLEPALFENAVTYSLGEFDPSETEQSSFGPATDIDTADIDRDGILDLIVARGSLTVESSPIHTFHGLGADGRGNGSFGPRQGGPFSFVPLIGDQLIEDFDNDGILDIVQIDRSDPFAGPGGTGLAPAFNRGAGTGRFGDGTFVAAGRTWGGERCDAQRRGVAGDLDRDGNLDLVVLSEFCFEVQAARGNGTSNFELVDPARIHRPGETTAFSFEGPRALALADLDGDHVLDLIVADGEWVRTFRGIRSFLPEFEFVGEVAMGRVPVSLAVGDFDGDHVVDVATANQGDRGASVLRGGGDGTLGTPTHYDIGGAGFQVITGDFNEDAVPDLAVAQPSTRAIRILLGSNTRE
jgi:hypothetical protein